MKDRTGEVWTAGERCVYVVTGPPRKDGGAIKHPALTLESYPGMSNRPGSLTFLWESESDTFENAAPTWERIA